MTRRAPASGAGQDELDLQRGRRLRAWMAAAVLVIVAWPALFWRLGHGPIERVMDGREALVIREMVRTSDLVLPLRNGEDVPHKPPFMHWVGTAVAHLRGGVVDEATVRLPSALATLVSLLVTFGIVASTHDVRRALLAALVLLTTSGVSSHARESWVDPTLAAAVAAALACAWSMLRRSRVGGGRLYLFYALVGIAVLAKGPVGLAVPALALLAFLASTGQLALGRAFLRPSAVAVLAAVALPWYAAALVRGGAAFARTQLLTENLVRLVHGPEGSEPPWYFLRAICSEAAPWVAVLPFALRHAWRTRRERRLETFALAWLVAPFLLFSAAAGKRHVYLLPLMPAVAILTIDWVHALPAWRPWGAPTPRRMGTALGRAVGTGPVRILVGLLVLLLPYVTIVKPLRLERARAARALRGFATAVRAAANGRPLGYVGTGELSDVFFYLDGHVRRTRCGGDLAACPPGLYLVRADLLDAGRPDPTIVRPLVASRPLSNGRRQDVVLVEVVPRGASPQ